MSEVKNYYTKIEVVEMLVKNNNIIMANVVKDNKKFVIEGAEVICYRTHIFLPDTELSRYSFDYCIEELK